MSLFGFVFVWAYIWCILWLRARAQNSHILDSNLTLGIYLEGRWQHVKNIQKGTSDISLHWIGSVWQFQTKLHECYLHQSCYNEWKWSRDGLSLIKYDQVCGEWRAALLSIKYDHWLVSISLDDIHYNQYRRNVLQAMYKSNLSPRWLFFIQQVWSSRSSV